MKPTTPEDYTHTRIGTGYKIRLKKLAEKNKRSALQQLHYLIEQAEGKK